MSTIDTSKLNTNLRQFFNADGQRDPATANDSHGAAPSANRIDVDSLFLNNMRPQQATDFLAQQINRRLGQQFAIPQVQTPGYAQNYDNANASANSILQMANHAFHKISPQQGIAQAASNIRQQIDHGFNDALQNFSVFGQLSADTQDGINAVRGLLNQAYQKAPLNGNVEQTQNLFAQMQSVSSSLNTSLSIQTAEGDVVTIELSHSLSSTKSSISGDNGDQSLQISQNENSENFELNIKVEGNLNDDEKAAVAQLVKQLSQIDAKQNPGNDPSSATQADNLVYDRNIISAFDYSQQTVETQRTVSLTSSQTSAQPNDGNAVADPGILRQIEDNYKDLPVKDLHQTVISIMKRLREFRELIADSVSKSTENQPEVQA